MHHKKRLLVVGAKGFIGSRALEFMKNNGYDCWGCDVLTVVGEERYFVIDENKSNFDVIFKECSFDICINCSGAASVSASLENPYRDFTLNTLNVFRILEAIRQENPNCRFLNISSAAVYGNPSSIPVTEKHLLKPLSPYGLHKMQAEEICKEFNLYYGIKTCSARVFSAYGIGLKKQLFWDVYQKALKGNEIILFGTGNETRDFIFIDDLVEALFFIIENASFSGESVNVANGERTKISEAVEILLKRMDWIGNLVFDGRERKGDPLYWEADISILNSFKYKQKHSLVQGLDKYVRWLEGVR